MQQPGASTGFTYPLSYAAPDLLMSLVHADTPGCVSVSSPCGCLWSVLPPETLVISVFCAVGEGHIIVWGLEDHVDSGTPAATILVSVVYAAVCDHVDVMVPFASKYK